MNNFDEYKKLGEPDKKEKEINTMKHLSIKLIDILKPISVFEQVNTLIVAGLILCKKKVMNVIL